MARVPTYDSPQVQLQGLPNARVEAAPVGQAVDVAARQGMQFNQAVDQLADTTHRIGMDMLEQANQLRVDDALNKAKEEAMRLTFDPQAGFQNIRGQAALERASGQALSDEYTGMLRTKVDEIAASLSNDRQRMLFEQRLAPVAQQFRGQLMQHESNEFRTYATSVREGTISNRMQEIGLNYNNPAVIDDAVKSIQASTYDLARLNGRSAEWAEAQARKMTSNAHLVALQAALDKNDALYADQYLKKYGAQMDANDLLRAQGLITKEVDAQIGQAAAASVMTQAMPKMMPTDFDRLTALVMGQESRGRDFDAAGNVLTSPKGAKGRMQVMDGTNRDPGFGVKPAQNDSLEERARVGRDYLAAMLREFRGNTPQALAAYNAGPGAVKEAVKKAEKDGRPADWLSYLPKETREYVPAILKGYSAGGGAPARPTLQEMQAQAEAALGPNPSMERRRIAREAVSKAYADATAAIKQREDEAVANAQRALIENGGNFAALPATLRAAIPPGQFDNLMTFAGKLAQGQPIATNWDLYYALKRDPQVLAATNLATLRDKLGDTEFKQLVNEQQDLLQGKTDDITRLRSGKDILNQFMREAGIDPTPKDTDKEGAARVGMLWNAFEQRVRERETATGKKLSPEEMKPIAAQLFTAVEVDRPWLWNASRVAGEVRPDQMLEVPKGERKLIEDALRARGLKVDDAAVQNLYRRKLGIAPYQNNG
jgi:hypothetical protein